MRTRLLKAVLALGILYVVLCGALLVAMLQPPARFGQIISKVENPVLFIALPFKRLWYVARDGMVETGDQAPDFELQKPDRASSVRLSSLRGKPVVLVFGSYT
jgi:hypothetical protein